MHTHCEKMGMGDNSWKPQSLPSPGLCNLMVFISGNFQEKIRPGTSLFLEAPKKDSEAMLSWEEMGIWSFSQHTEPSP